MQEAALEIVTHSEAQTVALGEALGRAMRGGELVALIGELGTGKTHLIQGLARGLGVADESAVTSPTFVLINEYEGRVDLYHIDAYRLEGAGQLAALGFEEMLDAGGVTVVEWADRVWELVGGYEPMEVRLEHAGETDRVVRLMGVSEGMRAAAQEWARRCEP